MDRNAPIGVFDSGLGGLTVVKALLQQLPDENLVYLGDNARVPYGTRSEQTIIRYAQNCTRKLVEHDIKMLVVACNTVSAVALDILRVDLDIPVLGVIDAGARAGTSASQTGRIGVIGTTSTITSGAYERAVSRIDSRSQVFSKSTPLLVPLVEEGWIEGEIPQLVVRRYLESFAATEIDVLVLGCTHYPLLQSVIASEISDLRKSPIPVVDSATATAQELSNFLKKRNLGSTRQQGCLLRMLVTDMPNRFSEVASRFLGENLKGMNIEQIDL